MHHIYNKKVFFFFALPLFIFFTALFILPMFVGFYYSLTNFRGVGIPKFNNFANYKHLFEDRFLGTAIINTLKMGISNLIVVLPTSFLLAYALRKTSRKNSIYKTVLFAPYVIPGAISGLIWYFIFEPGTGLINNVLIALGLESLCQQWIGGTVLTPYCVGVIVSWAGLGFYMMLWQLGMKNLPGEVLEAGLIDGCSKRQQITKIVIPMLRDTSTNIIIFVTTGALKIYETVYVLTGGGPNHASESIVSYLYAVTFSQKFYGYGMAIAVVEFVLAMTVSIITIVISNRTKIEY